MKKLVASTTKGIGGKSIFEEKIVEKKNKEFFDNLKKTKPYYKAAQWEDDYKKQVRILHTYLMLNESLAYEY